MKSNFFKNLIQKKIPEKKEEINFSKRSYSQEGEDMILAEMLLGQSNGFYVDIGAFHPLRFSNTQYFYELGWRGINIEPSPDAITDFQNQRQDDVNLNLGVSDSKGELIYYIFDEPALNTFDFNRVQLLEKETHYRSIRNVKVQVDRLDSILGKYALNKKIDFMNIDVEWHEMNVLKSNDWNKFRPRVLLVEILDFDLETIQSNPIHAFLKQIGYKFEAKTPRTCFYLDTIN